MHVRRLTEGMLLLACVAGLGYLLVVVPPRIVEGLRFVQEHHPLWVTWYIATVAVGGLLMLGATLSIVIRLWRQSRRKRVRREQRRRNPSELSAAEKQRELATNLAAIAGLRDDASAQPELSAELARLEENLVSRQQQQRLEIAAFGTVSSGKSSVLNLLAGRDVFATDVRGGTTVQRSEVPWPGADKVTLVDTPGLGEIDGAEHVRISTDAAKDADLVLLVVDGPLRDFEFDLIRRLAAMEKRLLLCLNKADWYDATQQARLLQQLSAQVDGCIAADHILAVTAQPVRRRRVRLLPDGTQREEEVELPADIWPLAERLLEIVQRDGRELLLANLLLQSRGLVTEARDRVRQVLDRRAWEIVDKYMWGAGSAAALSPLPILDLAAGGALTVKLVLDLAGIYRHELDLEAATRILAQLGKNLVAMLGVSLATPAVVAAVASLLKSVPGVGTVAGGLLQGVVQALVIRWIGGVFIRYFGAEAQADERGLAELARQEWERVTSVGELRKLVQTARSRLASQLSSATRADENVAGAT